MPNRFLLIDYAHTWIGDTLHVRCTTDIACHLWLRWTDKEEHMHLRSKTDRGLDKLADPDYCFVEWREVEQNEAGDTIKHTFTFGEWAECQRRWWMFRGQVDGQDSPSNTAIFTAHYKELGIFTLGKYTIPEVLVSNVKLEQGMGINLEFDEDHNSIIISTV